MVAKVMFTDLLIEQLSFDRMVTGTTKAGRPIIAPTPKGTHSWMVRDLGQPGLMMRLTSGTTAYCIRRKFAGNSAIRTLGHAWTATRTSPPMSLDLARKRARRWLADMDDGKDPLKVRKDNLLVTRAARERARITMAVAFDELIATKKKVPKAGQRPIRDNTDKDRRTVVKWLTGSPMWSMPLTELDLPTVKASLDPVLALSEGQDRTVAWGPKSVSFGTLNKIFLHCSAAWGQAAKKLKLGDRKEGPFAQWRDETRVRWPEQGVRQTLLDTDTLAGVAWLKALLDLQARAHDLTLITDRPDPRGQGLKPHTSVLVDFYVIVLLWGTRKTETALLEWRNVDFEKRVAYLAADTTKNRARDSVPLTAWVMEILRKRKRMNELWRPDDTSPFVFPSRRRGYPLSNPRGVLLALHEETGLMVNAHDLRRTMATEVGSEQHMQQAAKLLLAGAAMHHGGRRSGTVISAVTERYIQKKAEALRPIYQDREDKLRKLVGLPVLAGQARDEGDADDVLSRLRTDPGFKKMVLEALMKG
jgi:hypothetical protein